MSDGPRNDRPGIAGLPCTLHSPTRPNRPRTSRTMGTSESLDTTQDVLELRTQAVGRSSASVPRPSRCAAEGVLVPSSGLVLRHGPSAADGLAQEVATDALRRSRATASSSRLARRPPGRADSGERSRQRPPLAGDLGNADERRESVRAFRNVCRRRWARGRSPPVRATRALHTIH